MNLVKFLFTIYALTLLLLAGGCNPGAKSPEGDSQDDAVRVKTKNIFNVPKLEVVGGEDRGEFLLGGPLDKIQINFTNYSEYNLFDLNLDINMTENIGVDFAPNESGKLIFPGFEGTCGTELQPNETCTIIILLNPSNPGLLEQKMTFRYRNYINQMEIPITLKVLTGHEASVIFTEGITTYNIGLRERTEAKVEQKTLEIKNVGELSAKNLTIDVSTLVGTNAFKLIEHNCPESLSEDETCHITVEYQPQNYGPEAPDGENELEYRGSLKMSYIRNPQGMKSYLNAYFTFLSTAIEARIKREGSPEFSFSELVVGNTQSITLRYKNNGYKEGIIRGIRFKRVGDTTTEAICVKESDGQDLECRNPATVDTPGALPLATFPFHVKDLGNCIDLYSKMDYTRDPSGNISDPSVITIEGRTLTQEGQTCTFGVTFHPSVTYLAPGDHSYTDIFIEYDSTWKNNIVFYNDTDEKLGDYLFRILDAPYIPAGALRIVGLNFSGRNMAETGLETVPIYDYHLGRLALILSPVYASPLSFYIENYGGYGVTEVAISDGADRPVNSGSGDYFNQFYRQVKHSGCDAIASLSSCNVSMMISPVSLGDESLQNAAMFDDLTAQRKIFNIEYKDGAMYEDDLSLRAKRQVQIQWGATLITKGRLVYEDGSTTQGNMGQLIAGNEQEHVIVFSNVGTGAIPYISGRSGNRISDYTTFTHNNPYPVEIIDTGSGRNGADYDCKNGNFIDFYGTLGTLGTLPLPSGKSCSMTLKFGTRNTDVRGDSYYSNIPDELARRDFSLQLEGQNRITPPTMHTEVPASTSQILAFDYYDGDSTANPLPTDPEFLIFDSTLGYIRPVTGNYTVSGDQYSQYNIAASFITRPIITPINPKPKESAVIYRQGNISIPGIPIDKWGNAVSAKNIVAPIWAFLNFDSTASAQTTVFAKHSIPFAQTDVNDVYDYTLHGGTFPLGATYTIGFSIQNSGGVSASIKSINLASSDPELTLTMGGVTTPSLSLGPNSLHNIELSFTPTSAQLYEAVIEVTYESGISSYGDITKEFLIQARGISGDHPKLKVESIAWMVTWNEILGQIVATAPTYSVADPTYKNHLLIYNSVEDTQANMLRIEGVKGSDAFSKNRIYITNTSSSTVIPHLNLHMLRGSIDTSVLNFEDLVTGFSIDNSGGCLEANLSPSALDPGDRCYIDITYKPGINAMVDSGLTYSKRYLNIGFEVAANQYVAHQLPIRFYPMDPATVSITGTASMIISDNSVPKNNYTGVYPYDIDGDLAKTGINPILLNTYPSKTISFTVNLFNSSEVHASFLAQYRKFVGDPQALTPATNALIYDQAGVDVTADHNCFDADPTQTLEYREGFNITYNLCKLYVNVEFDGSDIEKRVGFNLANIDKDFIISLDYYSHQRSSIDKFRMFFRFFVQPDKSTALGGFENVYAQYGGKVGFDFPTISPNESGWGPITGYRVIVAPSETALNDIYQLPAGVTYKDLSSTSYNVTDKKNKTFYYFKIAAIRQYNSKNYLSETNLPVLRVVVPPTSSVLYFHDQGILVDKNPIYTMNYKQQQINTCAARKFSLIKNGLTYNLTQRLVNLQTYHLLKSDPSYSSYNILTRFHWLYDAPVNIATIFDPYDSSQTTGRDEDENLFYNKSCVDNSCNMLSIMAGGSDDFPPDTILYTEPTKIKAFGRCLGIVPP